MGQNAKERFYLGESNGKHSEVVATYDEIVNTVLQDPVDIPDFIAKKDYDTTSIVTDALLDESDQED